MGALFSTLYNIFCTCLKNEDNEFDTPRSSSEETFNQSLIQSKETKTIRADTPRHIKSVNSTNVDEYFEPRPKPYSPLPTSTVIENVPEPEDGNRCIYSQDNDDMLAELDKLEKEEQEEIKEENETDSIILEDPEAYEQTPSRAWV